MMEIDRDAAMKASSEAAFKIYDMELIEDMRSHVLIAELARWRDWGDCRVAIGRPSALMGLIRKIAELRREIALLLGRDPCEMCGDTGIIATTRSVAGPDGKDEVVSYSGQACPKCGPPIVKLGGGDEV